jgi:hypothetical protein
VLALKSFGQSKDFLDVELRQHCRTIASADALASFGQVLRLSADTLLLLQDALEDKAEVKRAKVRFVEDLGAFDSKLPAYDYIKLDQVQAAVDQLQRSTSAQTNLGPGSKKTNLDDVMDNLDKLVADHKALGLQFSKASESTILDPNWINELGSLQNKTAQTTDNLQAALSDAHLDSCKKATHFQSDYYRLLDLQEHNRKKREEIKSRARELEKRNEKIRLLCRVRLDGIVKEANDPRLLERVSKHNSEIEDYLKISLSDVRKVTLN